MLEKRKLVNLFIELATIDSESGSEGEISSFVRAFLDELGVEWTMDNAHESFGGECGNIIARLPGRTASNGGSTPFEEPLLLASHLDTVSPGKEVRPRRRDDVIESAGPTILGADDKAGVAMMLCVVEQVLKDDAARPPLELVFTVSEEKGLSGSKALDYSKLESRQGLALDGTGLGTFTVSAPYKTVLEIEVSGHSAHSANPRAGINAIQVAAQALSKMRIGLVDDETTCNVSSFVSSYPTNVIPDKARLEIEVRSLSKEKLEAQVEHVNRCLREGAASFVIQKRDGEKRPAVSASRRNLYEGYSIDENDPFVARLVKAALDLDIEAKVRPGMGGSDANNFMKAGIKMVNMGVGMHSAHTTREWLSTYEFFKSARLLYRIITGR